MRVRVRVVECLLFKYMYMELWSSLHMDLMNMRSDENENRQVEKE